MNGYTSDVIRSLSGAGRAKLRRLFLEHRGDDPARSLMASIGAAMIPTMENAPTLAKEFVARVMLYEVDWKAVAEWLAVDPEAN